MFTGIVEELGSVAALEERGGTARLEIACEQVVEDAAVGDSINTNGCCLTVTALTGRGFVADLMGETLARTGLGALRSGDPVNLERALRADARFGGHLVTGHVDATARVIAVEDHGEWTVMRCSLPPSVRPFVAEKGSISVDGTSLTVMGVEPDAFAVGLIPHTLAVTVLGRRRPGDVVNLEADLVARYVQRLVAASAPPERAASAPADTALVPIPGATRKA
jgi:riboflavin synthase